MQVFERCKVLSKFWHRSPRIKITSIVSLNWNNPGFIRIYAITNARYDNKEQ